MFKQIPRRFIHPWLCFERGPGLIRPDLFAWVQRLVLEGKGGANLDKADGVCPGVVRICMQVNVS